ncbi:hypothetical protein EDB85DRAFT_1900756 [Lactarius pseudohatsudake]|nr:hypothetical protein EDB85DRAFT_1900756 [Lactarius pseudohatsudake]
MGDMTSTRTHTRQIPSGLMGMGSGGPGYGFRRPRVWVPAAPGMGSGGSRGYRKPARVGTAGWHVTVPFKRLSTSLLLSSSSALDPSTSGSFAWGLEGVKVSQGVARCLARFRGTRAVVGAAESGAEMGSIGRRWSETVVHACAQLETLHVRPFVSGTRCIRVVKAARECGMLGNARNKQVQDGEKRGELERMRRWGKIGLEFAAVLMYRGWIIIQWLKTVTPTSSLKKCIHIQVFVFGQNPPNPLCGYGSGTGTSELTQTRTRHTGYPHTRTGLQTHVMHYIQWVSVCALCGNIACVFKAGFFIRNNQGGVWITMLFRRRGIRTSRSSDSPLFPVTLRIPVTAISLDIPGTIPTLFCLIQPSTTRWLLQRLLPETIMMEVEEGTNDCSRCLPVVKDLRSRLLAEGTELAADALHSDDECKCDTLKKQLLREEERCTALHSDIDELRAQLEMCQRDLNEAEKQRAAAIVFRTEVVALKERLSEEEQKAQDLSTELSQRERELVRLKDKEKARSARGKSPPEIYSIADTTSLSGQPFSQAMLPSSQSRGPTQEHFSSKAHSEAEKVYESRLEGLHLKIQSLEKALKEANALRNQVETELENEISRPYLDTVDRDPNDVPVGGHGAADISPILDQGTDQQSDGDTPNAGVSKTELEHDMSHSKSCHLDTDAVDQDPKDVPVGGHGAADISPALNQGENQQSDCDISNVDVAQTEPEIEISHSMPCHPNIDAVGKHSTDVPVGGYGATDTSSALKQGEDQQFDGDISDADVAKLVPPSSSFPLARRPNISGEYSGLHPRLIIISSIFVGCIAVVIQLLALHCNGKDTVALLGQPVSLARSSGQQGGQQGG